MSASDRVCIALDYPRAAEAVAMAQRLAGRAGWMKVGLEVFVAEGPPLVERIAATGARVFLDLKFHDIPATVAGAVLSAARSGAAMVNVHASGGRAMLEAARKAADAAGLPKLIAVTLLTSIDLAALADLPISGNPEGIARRLAVLAKDCGLDGVVCSATDLPAIRERLRPRLSDRRPRNPAGRRGRPGPEARRDAGVRHRRGRGPPGDREAGDGRAGPRGGARRDPGRNRIRRVGAALVATRSTSRIMRTQT